MIQLTRVRTLVTVLTALLLAMALVALAPPARADVGVPDEVGLFDPATGEWYLRHADGTVDRFYYGVPGDVPLLGDWDCDGVDTVGMFRPTNGFVYLRNSNTQGFADISFFFGIPGDIPIAGDWNADGCDTLGVYRNGEVFILNSLETAVAETSYFFGIPGDRPFTGDFDGDGATTVGLYRQSSGFAYFTNSHTTGFADLSFFYGTPSDRILSGDWDGDGDETVGIFRPGDSTFYLSNVNAQVVADTTVPFGSARFLPVAGNYDPTNFGPPEALDDEFELIEGGVVTGNVLDNDVSNAPAAPNSPPPAMTATLVSPPTYGALTLNGDGSFTYNHGGTENHEDSFTYQATDEEGTSNLGTVDFSIDPINDNAPIATADAYDGVNEGQTMVVDVADGVLANDTDADRPAEALTVTLGDDVSFGTLALAADGSFTYAHNDSENHADSFTYTVSDGTFTSDPQTASIAVTPINDAPTAVADGSELIPFASGTEDGTITTPNVLTNDEDVDATDVLVVSGADATSAAGATITNIGDGTFTYDPAGSATLQGLVVGETTTDTFGYTVSDGNGGTDTATVTVEITGVNDDPSAANVSDTADEDGAIITGAFDADDVDTDDTPASLTYAILTNPAEGTASLGTLAGTFDFDPGTDFQDLAADETREVTFNYTVSDGNGGTDTATVTIEITGVNDDPSAVADGSELIPFASSTEDGTITTGNVLTNDEDVDATDVLVVGSADATSAAGATITNIGDGTFTYDPAGLFEALAAGETATDTFDYTVSDGNGGTDTATVTIEITGVNDDPSAVADGSELIPFASSTEDGTITTGNVLTNDEDVDATDVLVVGSADATSAAGATITNIGDGTFTYDPAGLFEALAAGETATDTFDYTVSDGNGGTDTATVTIEITGVNDDPSAVADGSELIPFASSTEDGTITTGNVLTNDEDVDATDVLVVGSADATSAAGATITNIGDGTFTYDPAGLFEALAAGETATDTFDYTVSDGNGGTDTATVTIEITGVNDDPSAVADGSELIPFASSTEDGTITTGNVLTNDEDVDATDVLVVGSADATSAAGATITNIGDGTFTYDPAGLFEALAAGETATDTFDYTVSDGNGGTDTATVTIEITGVNDDPSAVADGSELIPFASSTEDGTITTGNVLTNDEDVDATDVLVVGSADATSAAGATITNIGDGTFTYDPAGLFEALAAGETATDTFDYTVSDGNGGTDTATVTIEITGVNDDPSAVADGSELIPFASSTEDGTITTGNVLTNDEDVDATDVLVVGSADATSAAGATITNIGDGTFTYDPAGLFEALAAGETATDTFDYTVSDGNGGTDTATVTIEITGVNDDPSAVADGSELIPFASSTEDGTITTGNVLTNDEDVDATDVLVVGSADATSAAGATITNIGDGTFTYDPAGLFEALAAGETATDTFDYTVSDGNGGTDTATVTIEITGVNDDPSAVADGSELIPFASSTEDGTITTGNVLTNDEDVDATDVLVVGSADATSAAGATITNIGDGTFTYDPAGLFEALAAGETATDTFDYTVSDGNGGTDTATVTIEITGVNDDPSAVADGSELIPFASSTEDGTITTGNVLTNDEDVDATDVLVVGSADATSAAGATITNIGDGTFTYDPAGLFEALAAGETATDTFDYTVSDGNGGTDTATVTIEITGVNDAPVIPAGQVFEMAYDAANTSPVGLVDGSDVDAGDTLSNWSITGGNPDGVFAMVGATGALRVADNTNVTFGQSYELTITVQDSSGALATETVTVIVNRTPEATSDATLTVDENLASGAVVGTVVATDPDAAVPDTLSYAITAGNTPVAFAIDSNGLITTTKTFDYETDATTYILTVTVTDSAGALPSGALTDTATITITINDKNEAPEAVVDTDTATENAGSTTDVLANDTDVDSDDSPANFSLDSIDSVVVSGLSIDPTLVTGSVTIDGSNLVFVPGTDFDELDNLDEATVTITYTMSDDESAPSSSTLTITVAGTNDAPEAAVDTDTATENAGSTTDVLANDTDVDSDDSPANFSLDSIDSVVVSGLSIDPTLVTGSVTIDGSNLVFVPGTDFDELDNLDEATVTITYTMSDDESAPSSSTLTITVAGTNDAPEAAVDTDTATENAGSTTDVLANDTDVDSDDSPANFSLDSIDSVVVSGLSIDPTLVTGSVTIDGSNLVFVPGTDFDELDNLDEATVTITYTMSDDESAPSSSTLTITVAGTNDAPEAAVDTDTATENAGSTTDVLANDTDVDSDDSPANFSLDSIDSVVVSGLSIDPTLVTGSVTIDGSNLVFVPGTDFDELDNLDEATVTITYTMSDDESAPSSSTLTITVAGTNDAPEAAVDTDTATENAGSTTDVLANDTDVDSDDSPANFSLDSIDSVVVSGLSIDPTLVTGSVTIDGSNLVFVPGTDFDELDNLDEATVTITYTMSDDESAPSSSTLTITVAGTNDAPEAVVDTDTATENAGSTTDVLANDTDVDSDDSPANFSLDSIDSVVVSGLSIDPTLVTGSVTIDGSNLVFVPGTDFDELDNLDEATVTITYTMSDDESAPSSSTLTITVAGTNDAPEAVVDTDTATENAGSTTDVLANDTDVDSDDSPANFSLDSIDSVVVSGLSIDPTLVTGSVTIDGSNLVFVPGTDFDELDNLDEATVTITYTMSDDESAPSSSTLTITVAGTNDAPEAVVDTDTATENAGSTTDVLANDTDVDSDDSPANFSLDSIDSVVVSGLSIDPTLVTGSVTIDGSNLVFVPGTDFDELDNLDEATVTITYTMSDDESAPSSSTLTITVAGTNDAPEAVVDTDTATENAGSTTDVLANDTDVDSDDSPANFSLDSIDSVVVSGLSIDPTLVTGSVTIDGSNLVFVPGTDFDELDNLDEATVTITYTMSDDESAPSSSTLTITVAGTNDAPEAVVDTDTATENAGSTTDVLANDTDVDSDDSPANFSLDSIDSVVVSGLSIDPTLVTGSVTIDGSNLVFVPGTDFDELDNLDEATVTITYTMSDDESAPSSSTLTITVAGTNDAPVIPAGQVFEMAYDAANTSPVGLVDGSDVDAGDTLSNWSITGGNPDGVFAMVGATGALRVADNTNVTFGQSYELTITVQDSSGALATETVTVIVNRTPEATSDATLTVDENLASGAVVGTVVATDPDAAVPDTLSYAITAGNTPVAFAIDSNGLITTTKTFDYETDATTYILTVTVTDSAGALPSGALTDTATITITINDKNDQLTSNGAETQTAPYTEDDASVAIGDIVVSDVDTGETITATITLNDTGTGAFSATDGATYSAPTWTVTGTVAEVNTALANLVFVPAADNDLDTTATVNIVDGLEDGALVVTGTITLDVTARNDQLTSNGAETQTAPYTEDDASVAIGDIVVSDVDTGETITATITLNDTATGAFSATDGATYSAPTWTVTGTVAEVNTALANLVFVPAADNDLDTTATVNIVDGLEDGALVVTGTITLDVTARNDQLTSNGAETQTAPYTEDDASVAIGDIVVSDVDTGETITATITLNDTATGAFSATDGATYSAPTWTVTGTVAEVNTALANLVFVPAADNDLDTTATVNIVDGLEDGALVVTGTITLDVTPVNDDPVIAPSQIFNVPADAANLDSVGIVDGSDVDTVDAHTWSITGGNDLGVFSMVGLTGQLKVADNATLASGQSYILEITVVDSAGGTGVETVTVNIVEPSV